MEHPLFVRNFSGLSKSEKIDFISKFATDPQQFVTTIEQSWHSDPKQQKLLDEFSENTLGNYDFPFGIAPNFLINGRMYMVPVVIEESSVVAAASGAAKFWSRKGGFHSEVLGLKKIGQVHFRFHGPFSILQSYSEDIKKAMLQRSDTITANMKGRGGGILSIELLDFNHLLPDYGQVKAVFDTRDSMGANFINTCLEEFAEALRECAQQIPELQLYRLEVIMSILSNYTPDCIVRTWLEGDISSHRQYDEHYNDEDFLDRFAMAVRIAEVDTFRAATHNKGIYNGIDSVVLATGNDFRAVEACGHAHAARDGHYRSLSHLEREGNQFRFVLEVPMALGTVGGLTVLHPMARLSLDLLGHPDAATLMTIASSMGLANNYAALRSLVTKGIQRGHMKMHLLNILNMQNATEAEKQAAIEFFRFEKVTHSGVNDFLASIRK